MTKIYRIIALVLVIALVFALVGCGDTRSENKPQESPSAQNESLRNEDKKEMLPLVIFYEAELPETEPADVTVGELNIPANGLSEMSEQKYETKEELKALEEYVKNVFSVELNENWSMIVHFIDDEQTAGMIRFRYDIGEIKTNKAFTFSVEAGMIASVYYSCLAEDTDEQALLDRVNKFRGSYEQEKYEPKNGETLTDETTDFSYYYHTGELRYTYNVFFANAEGVINNDYGTEVLIDENGSVVR